MPTGPGLVIDFGGVLTTHLGDAFRSFCEREGVDYEQVRARLREAYGGSDPESLVARFETGRMPREEFERELAVGLSEGLHRPIDPEGLIERMLTDLELDDAMVNAVRAARARGVPTALLSNSWGVEYYPHDLLAELFDHIVISGEVGLRKPDPDVFRMASERLGLAPEECVFVDDLASNVAAAEAVGMRGVLHEKTPATIAELERLLDVPLVPSER
jgi:putative hydrolase of the HAD superfamily